MSKLIKHQAGSGDCAHNRRATGRLRLPIAPQAQAMPKCAPQAPLPRSLSPQQAMKWLEYLEKQGREIRVINISGPGDPLASPGQTMLILGMLRQKYPQISLCLATLGFGALDLAPKMAELGLAHVSILMDAASPQAAREIYAWIRPGNRTLPLTQAAEVLIEEQARAIAALAGQGLEVQIKATLYPGTDPENIMQIAAKGAELGASQMKLFPYLVRGCALPPSAEEIERYASLAERAAEYLPARFIDPHTCQEVIEFDFSESQALEQTLPKPSAKRPNLAVCSSDGFEVDLHLGQAAQYLIYGPNNGPVVLLETRPAPEPGGGESRWKEAALTLSDCFCVLAASAGEAPKRILAESGLMVLAQEDNIEGLVDALYGGGKGPGKKKGG
jgi:nitrogen fixation protein NifB